VRRPFANHSPESLHRLAGRQPMQRLAGRVSHDVGNPSGTLALRLSALYLSVVGICGTTSSGGTGITTTTTPGRRLRLLGKEGSM